MPDHKPLYRWSLETANHNDERDLWRESYKENCDCARAIEKIIADNYDGRRLGHNLAEQIIERYGFDRVNWVLANTVQQKKEDGRFSCENKEWAKGIYIPRDDVRWHFTVESHPGLTDLFLDQARHAWQALELFEAGHCISETDGEMDYTNQVLALKPEGLKDAFKTPGDQLFLAKSGFGCRPDALGRKVYGQFLKDGENTHFYRQDFLGVLKDEYLPEWAAEKLAEMQPSNENQENDMTMGM